MRGYKITTGRSRTWEVILIVGLFAFLSGGFSFTAWPLGDKTYIRTLSVILLFYFVFKVSLKKTQNFRRYVLALAFLPFVSVFYSYHEYGQPVFDGIKGTLPSLLWLFYFVFHRFKIREASFLKAVFYIAVFIVMVQIVQQLTYPDVLFGVHDEEELAPNQELASNRNGIWRFYIGSNGVFTAIILFFVWCKMRMRFREKHLLIIVLMLVSIYLTLTRQLIFSALLTLFLSYFLGKKNIKLWVLLSGLAIVVLLYIYSDTLFGDFIKQTEDESSKDYIRFISANYFWTETFTSVQAMFFGHGTAVSGYFLSLKDDLEEEYSFHVNDVGFIGMMWVYGLFYVYLCYDLLMQLFWDKKSSVPLYIRLFVIFASVISVMIFPMFSYVQRVMWCFLLYICDIHINKSKKAVL